MSKVREGGPVPTNEQRRQAAKRKLERQLARRAERAKRRRIVGVIVTVVAVVAAVGLVYWLANLGDGDTSTADTNTPTTEPTTPPGKTTEGPCKYAEEAGKPSPKPVGLPTDPAETPKTGTVKVNVKTSQGEVPLLLDRAKAPCTVQSMEFLVNAKFFDTTKCHRLTAEEGLKVLQCGDPTGTGGGGPGFTIPDEFPTDLKPAPSGGADQQGRPLMTYPRGVLAVANTGAPNSGSSQFFMVYGDSTLPAAYTVFGTIDAAGLTTLDKIAAGGITPGDRGPNDGAPKLETTIETATVTP
jgi:peptidyl-prolyl cis-trans isomerase B (cyclophilin B)